MSARLPLTPSQTIGPFWHALGEPHLAELSLPGAPAPLGQQSAPLGELAISVRDGGDAPVTDACLELWCPASSAWARAATDAQGVARFRLTAAAAVAAAPSSSPPSPSELVPPPLSVIVLARGLLKPLWTRLFFDEASLLHACPELSSLAPARRATLLADASSRPHWRWQLRLQGDAETETVFFDW